MVKIPNSKFQIPNSNPGFTLIELLVVLAIMAVIGSAVIANYAAQREPTNLRLGENQLVTNIREMESFALSSRNINATVPVQYYVLKFDTTNPRQYIIQAIYNANSSPAKVQNVQTINLPQNIRLAATNAITINGSGISSSCALLAFKLPFDRVIMNDGCTLPAAPDVSPNDSYDHLLSFISNGSGGTTFSDVPMVIKLTNIAGTLSKTVTVSGATGEVTFQ